MISQGTRIFRVVRMGSVGLLLHCASGPTLADVVHLKNGDRITGTVYSVSAGKVVVDTEFAGRLVVKLDAVEVMDTEEAFKIELSGGEKLDGALVAEQGTQSVAPVNAPPTPVALADIRTAGQSNLSFANLGLEWTSRADLSASVSRGNSETDAYNALIESVLKRNRSRHSVSLLLSQEEADGVATKEQLDFDYGYKRFLSDRWFFAGNGEYFEDQLKDVDYRITAGAGMGYQFWDNSFGALSVEAGGSVVIEALDGDKEQNPAFRWALDYNRFLFSQRLEAFHKHSILFIPDRGQVIDTSTGLRLAINNRLSTALRVDLQHETDPPEDSKKTDVTYNLGVGIKF